MSGGAGDRKPLLSQDLRILLVSMVLANIGSHMMFPLLAVYLTSMGAEIGEIGLFFTLSSIFPLLVQILGGWISDSIGRLRAIALGSMSGVLGYLPFILAPSYWWVLLGEALFAVARALVGPSFTAFTAEESESETRGRTFGSTQTIFLLVQVIGPGLGGLLADSYGFRTMFLVSGGFYLCATLIRLGMARRVAQRVPIAQESIGIAGLKRQLSAIGVLMLAGGVITWILIIDGVRDVSFRMSMELMPVYMEDIGGLSVTQIGLLNSLVGVAAMLFTPLGGWLTDRKEERYPIVIGSLLSSLAFAAFLATTELWGFALSWILFGFSWGLVGPAYQSLISKAVPQKLLGTAFGFFDTSLGLISLPAPWIGSQLWARITPQTPFLLTMIVSAVTSWPAWLKFRLPKQDLETGEPGEGPGVNPGRGQDESLAAPAGQEIAE